MISQNFDEPFRLLSIDPGMSGAGVLLSASGELLERETDFKDTADLSIRLGRLAQQASGVVMELVGAMPGQGVVSMFHFGEAFGAAKAVVATNGHASFLIPPQTWQNEIRRRYDFPRPPKGSNLPDLFDTQAICSTQFPGHQWFARKKDHNTADAVLLGYYFLWELGLLVHTARQKRSVDLATAHTQ